MSSGMLLSKASAPRVSIPRQAFLPLPASISGANTATHGSRDRLTPILSYSKAR
jgi:hypothetical protein